MRLKHLEPHLSHHLVIGALKHPVSKAVLASCLPRHEIDVRDRHVRVRIASVAVEVHDDITRAVRCDLLRQRVGSVTHDLRRHRIVRVELVGGERLDHHEGLILATAPSEH